MSSDEEFSVEEFSCLECNGRKDPRNIFKETYLKQKLTCYFCKGLLCEDCDERADRVCVKCVNKRLSSDFQIPIKTSCVTHVYFDDVSDVETEDDYLVCPCGAGWGEDDSCHCGNSFCNMHGLPAFFFR